MKISGFIENSLANGKGMRYVIFAQGCEHYCMGCHNEHTWDKNGGEEISVHEIVEKLKDNKDIITGITISGGEPFLQPLELFDLIKTVNKEMPELEVAVYTGFKLGNLKGKNELINEILLMIDVLIDGKFDISKREGALRYTGSSNQKIYCKEGHMWDGGIVWQ